MSPLDARVFSDRVVLDRQLTKICPRVFETAGEPLNAVHQGMVIERFADHGLNLAGAPKSARGVGAC